MAVAQPDAKLVEHAHLISRMKKYKFLKEMTEDDFRDRVIRPLFYRLGFGDGRDVCGPDEEGKDAIFILTNPLGLDDLIVVQTKAGNLNLASKASDNLLNAIAQLRTAFETAVPLIKPKQKRLPSKVILCASGKMNTAARKHVADEIKQPHLNLLDADDLIPEIDSRFPELWLDIDAEVMPYMRAVRRAIEQSSESLAITELLPGTSAAATDAMFLELYLWRNVLKLRRRKGTTERIPKFIEIPAVSVLGKSERLVLILGEGGSGKSTALRRMAYVLAGRALAAEPAFLIPVLIRAADVARRPSETILDFAVAECTRLTGSTKPPFGADELRNGRVVILLDGLDEVPPDSEKQSVIQRVIDFAEAYPKCLVVITSREYAFLRHLNALDRFTRYRVRKISLKQAEQLVDKLEKKGSLPPATSKELMRRLEEIHGMELNPLLVTVFAATTEWARQDIPANITELFKKFTEMMLGRWDASKGFGQQFHAPLKGFVLSKIAFEMHLARQSDIGVDDFRARVASELQNRGYEADAETLVDEIVDRSGLIRVIGDRLEFRHLLLQEFFAGRGIPSDELAVTLVFEDWWRRALVFYFGDRPSDSAGLSKVRSALPSRAPLERFIAAGTLGLALQASYLLPVREKIEGMVEVIETLADVKDDVIAGMPGAAQFPITRFLGYYLNGRDSVALASLENFVEEITTDWDAAEASEERREQRLFWLIVGLLEAGRVTEAEKLVSSFRPRDAQLLLGIHLGCVLIQHIRVSTDAQKKSAKRICDSLADDIEHLKRQVLNEFRTELIEVRQGEVKAISGGGSDTTD